MVIAVSSKIIFVSYCFPVLAQMIQTSSMLVTQVTTVFCLFMLDSVVLGKVI